MPPLRLTLRVFGPARDIVGGKEVVVEVDGLDVKALRSHLTSQFPKLQAFNSLLIAVNQKYASDEISLHETDEIAVIPPVSGG